MTLWGQPFSIVIMGKLNFVALIIEHPFFSGRVPLYTISILKNVPKMNIIEVSPQ